MSALPLYCTILSSDFYSPQVLENESRGVSFYGTVISSAPDTMRFVCSRNKVGIGTKIQSGTADYSSKKNVLPKYLLRRARPDRNIAPDWSVRRSLECVCGGGLLVTYFDVRRG